MKSSRFGLLLAAAILCSGVSLLQAQVNPGGTPVRINGKVISFKNAELLVAASNGQVAVKVPDAATIRVEVPMKIADIKPGMYVASSSQKQSDGTFRASQINIFPEEQRGFSEGHKPQTSRPGNMMTNANVEKIDEVAVSEVKGRMLTLKYKDGEIKVFVPPNTPIVRREVADRQMLKPGATVNISATQSADGSLAASQITVNMEPM
jgi:Domain of unknown function (DUF5666)